MSSDKITSKRVTFALFGLGRAGTIHGANIARHPEARLKYIVEPRVEHAQNWVREQELQGVTVVGPEKMHEVLQDPEVQAAMVASLTSTHEEIIRACFQHKKPVFSEKPIAATVAATVAVCDLSTSTGVPLLCGFNRRSDAQFIELKERLDAGDVGRLMMIKSTSYDYPTNCPIEYIKVSGGQLVDQSVHDIDICLMLAGGELPESVYAIGHAFYPDIAALGDTDTISMTIKFPSGVLCSIDNTRRALFGYDTRCEVLGDKGQLLLENLRPKNVVLNNYEGQHHSRIYDHFNTRFATAYNSELSHFIDYLKGRVNRLRITPAEAAAAVRVSMAAAESLKTGAPVKLQWK